MGQYFQIINIDKKQTLGKWGKLGEWFFDGSSARLIELLAEPSKPLSEDSDVHLVTMRSTPRQLGILRLPNEIIGLIFAEMDNITDVARLGFTCKLLLSISLTQIHAVKANILTHWTGDRLICIGTCMLGNDLPEGILTDAELRDLGFDECDYTKDIHEVATNTFCKAPTLSGLYYSHVIKEDYWTTYSDVARSIRYAEERIFRRLIKPVYSPGTWVLANLSKREFVRASAISDLNQSSPPSSKGPFVGRYLTLGAVMVSRICWAADPCSTGMCHGMDRNIHRGVWAGDRFTITTINKLDQCEGEKEWKDISKEVMEDMVAIWQNEFVRYNPGSDEWIDHL